MLPSIFKHMKFGKVGVLLLLLFAGGVLFYGLARMKGTTTPGEDGRYDVGTTPSRQMKGFVDHFGNLVDRQGREIAGHARDLDGMKGENATLKKDAGELRAELVKLKATLLAQNDPAKGTLEEARRNFFPDGREPETAQARIRKAAIPGAKEEALRRSKGHLVRIPPGSFAEATLLTGVYAPTEGQALPVKLRLDRAFTGPNRSRIPLQEAFLIGKAVGDPNSERAVIQLERLSYVKPGGETVETPINGYVVDEDGVQGVAGQYVWRAFDLASLAVVSGALSGGADAAAARETVAQVNPLGGASQVVTGDPLRFAGYRGASRAAEGMERLVLKRAEEIVPAIYVANGKKVTVCLIDGATLENLSTHEVKHEIPDSPFSGLDLDR